MHRRDAAGLAGKKPGALRFAAKAAPAGHSQFDLAARIS
jgi:hypothetical protein